MIRADLSRRDFNAALAASAMLMAAPGCAPRSAGFTPDGLERVRSAMHGQVASGQVPGLVMLLARGGEVHAEAVGAIDRESKAPMRRDTIFRIASMTKPVTAAAAMILVEEGRLKLDDPVDPVLPELANRRVLRTLASPLDDTVPAKRPISLRDLLTMRMGLGAIMEPPGKYPIQSAQAERELAPGADLFPHSPDEYLKRLGGLPLVHQPGERWLYHTGMDVAGILIARAAGTSLGAFLAERIFEPLGMGDTGFHVPEAKLDRLATAYRRDPAGGGLAVWDKGRGGGWSRPPAFEAGGGGLVSTADDYLAFANMMLAGGSHGSTRIFSRESVREMTTDQITPAQKAASPFFPGFWDTNGWGLGLSVTTAPDAISKQPGRYGWMGGYGTNYIADPDAGLVAILLIQRMMGAPDDFAIHQQFLGEAYRALAKEE